LLLAPEPGETFKARPFNMVRPVEPDMDKERNRSAHWHRKEQRVRQDEPRRHTGQHDRNCKERRIVVVVFEHDSGREMTSGIMSVMVFDMVAEERTTQPAMSEPTMHQSLAKRHDQMRAHHHRREQRDLDQPPVEPASHHFRRPETRNPGVCVSPQWPDGPRGAFRWGDMPAIWHGSLRFARGGRRNP
jgi:hypothetical protein